MQKDCIQDVTEEDIRRIHSHQNNGKLLKGYSSVPHTSSIPSKYQTLIIKDNNNVGFGAKTKRFTKVQHDTNPGPGKYKIETTKKRCQDHDSLKGFGGLAIKDNRIAVVHETSGPGSGGIALSRNISRRTDHNRSNFTPAFQSPISVGPLPKQGTPAPNCYKVCRPPKVEANVLSDACFKSKTKRGFLSELGDNPSPCDYVLNEAQTKKRAHDQGSMSKSKTERKLMKDPPNYPGPAAYNPTDHVILPLKVVFPRKAYLGTCAPGTRPISDFDSEDTPTLGLHPSSGGPTRYQRNQALAYLQHLDPRATLPLAVLRGLQKPQSEPPSPPRLERHQVSRRRHKEVMCPPRLDPRNPFCSRRHYLAISAPAMPLQDVCSYPAPNAYELVNYEGVPKHFMSGSVFVSGTTRWQPNGNAYDGLNIPGPAHYRPLKSDKQSFIYNSTQKWI